VTALLGRRLTICWWLTVAGQSASRQSTSRTIKLNCAQRADATYCTRRSADILSYVADQQRRRDRAATSSLFAALQPIRPSFSLEQKLFSVASENKVSPRGRRDDMPSADGSSTLAKIAADLRRVRSPHISGGRRWLSCRQPACL